jgi:hypothetical protein
MHYKLLNDDQTVESVHKSLYDLTKRVNELDGTGEIDPCENLHININIAGEDDSNCLYCTSAKGFKFWIEICR